MNVRPSSTTGEEDPQQHGVSPLTTVPSPILIAKQFIKHYYPIFTQSPEHLHKFYHPKESSLTYILSLEDASEDSGNGLVWEDIKEKLEFCRGARLDLTSGFIDAQKTYDGGVLVVVLGDITLKKKDEDDYENVQRKFVHTLLLRRSSKGKQTFFVSNDVFRFLDLQQQEPGEEFHDSPKEEGKEEEEVASEEEVELPVEVPVQEKKEEVSTTTKVIHEEQPSISTADKQPMEKETELKPFLDDIIVEQQQQQKQQRTSRRSVEKNTSKMNSWASLVVAGVNLSEEPATTTTTTTTLTTKSSSSAGKKQASTKTKTTSAIKDTKTSAAIVKRQGIPSTYSNIATSVYVRNVPTNTTREDLFQLFRELYPSQNIVHIAVYASRGFAFVEFDCKEAVQAILGGEVVKKIKCTWEEDVLLEMEGKKTERFHTVGKANTKVNYKQQAETTTVTKSNGKQKENPKSTFSNKK